MARAGAALVDDRNHPKAGDAKPPPSALGGVPSENGLPARGQPERCWMGRD